MVILGILLANLSDMSPTVTSVTNCHTPVIRPKIYNLFLQYIYILPILGYLPTYRTGRDVIHLDPLCHAVVFI